MTYIPSEALWPPQLRGVLNTIEALEQGLDVCLYSPTGGGKTTQAVELFNWCMARRWTGSFYLNRKLLVGQTGERFKQHNLPFGIRAADYEDYYDYTAPFQICSADTERSRVYQRKIWERHHSNLIIVDEAHIQKTGTMRKILDDHKEQGAQVVLLTATPVGLSGWADKLIVSGRMHEYRECKALVPAVVKTPHQFDLHKVKRDKVGEYRIGEKLRKIYCHHIVGGVFDRWKRYNPDARPALLYAPGKAESVFFTEYFMEHGVNWAHVDATDAIVDGRRAPLTRALWQEILERHRDGDIKGISSRFKLREGVDVPYLYHCILACMIGSLASYLQTVGRVMRWSPETPDRVLVTDHGGNYNRHLSPNIDRDWLGYWDLPERAVSEMSLNRIRDGVQSEPIRCANPECEAERMRGPKCPICGYEHPKSKRVVIQEDGRMIERDGDVIPRRVVKITPDTERLWTGMYFGYKNKRLKMTFNQMRGLFAKTHGYHPPRDLPYMPKNFNDWDRHVFRVERENLIPKRR